MESERLSILLVEDSDIDALVFTYLLADPQQTEFIQERAASLAEARKLLVKKEFDVVLLDLMLPDSLGFDTCSEVLRIAPRVPIVVLSSIENESFGVEIVEQGAQDWLVKGRFDRVMLIKTIRYAIQRKINVEKFRKSEALHRIILENAADLIFVIDRQGNHIFNSGSYVKLHGERWSKDSFDFGGLEHVFVEDREALLETIEHSCATGEKASIEYRIALQDGCYRTLDAQIGLLPEESGEANNHLFVIAHDITERKVAEKERVKMEAQLQQAQKLESVGQLAAGIAHEINTPIQYVSDNVRFINDAFEDIQRLLANYEKLSQSTREKGADSKMIEAIETIRKEADIVYLMDEIPNALEQSLEGLDRVCGLVQAMKQFSHPGQENKTAVDINKALATTVTVARHEWKYVANVVTDFDEDIPRVDCFPADINQVFLNLLVNAAHAIGEAAGGVGREGKGSITIITRRVGSWVEIRIRDTGMGIPEGIRDRIFDPFFTTKEVGQGTGQGLPISHSVIVDKHAGSITFETDPGQGTEFIIKLPFLKPATSIQ